MRDRLRELESMLETGSIGVRMVGIWGLGGSGKTTLMTSIFMSMSHQFQGHCIVGNVREESSKYGLKQLQESMLSSICKTKVKVQSLEEGKLKIKSMLCRRRVLILLDDVNTLDQLQALIGSHKWFGSGSRIIISTRDEHLLITHKVDMVYPVRLLSHDEAIELFRRHAYNEQHPVEDYTKLSLNVIAYAAGLPLALKVLGSFLFDKNKIEWISTMEKLKEIPDQKIIDILKVSYDGLETYQKELFLDIVCFWRRYNPIDLAMEIFEACGYHPRIGMKVLREKALISIVNDRFVMHDLIQEMGHYIVRGEHPNNPEKHNRVWNREEIRSMCFGNATMESVKIEAIYYNGYFDNPHERLDLSRLCKIVSNMHTLKWLHLHLSHKDDVVIKDNDEGPIFLSNELRYINWNGYPRSPFPDSFKPNNLVVLKLEESFQVELWKGFKHLPRLKVLELKEMKNLVSTPKFDGLCCLQKLILHSCDELKEIHPSLESNPSLEYLSVYSCFKLRMFPTFLHMENLKTLHILRCGLKDGEIPFGIGDLPNLHELNLSMNRFSRLDFSLLQLTKLLHLNVSYCINLIELPELPSSLAVLEANYCKSLTTIGDSCKNCERLFEVSSYGSGNKNDGGRLLQLMLEGKAIENGCLVLRVSGLEIPNGFTPPLFSGISCRLELPKNWCNDFSGFLMCAIFTNYWKSDSVKIRMKQTMDVMESNNDVFLEEMEGVQEVVSDSHIQDYVDSAESDGDDPRYLFWGDSDSDSEEDEISEEGDRVDDTYTWVGYVSFDSLRHTTWWDQTSKCLSFNIGENELFLTCCSDFGVRLLDKKRGSGLTETSKRSSSRYMPILKIEDDSTSALMVSLSLCGESIEL